MWLLANWKILTTATATLAICWMLHSLDVHRIEAKHDKEIISAKNALVAECNKAQAITKGISHDYQTKLASLNARLADAKRVHVNRCIAVQGATSAGYDGTATGAKPAGRNVGADRLIDYAGRAEKYRLQLISCQDFIMAR